MKPTQISPMLAVSDPAAAIDFYKRAFGAEERWRIGDPAEVAGLSIDGAEFFLARESPPNGTRSPDSAGHTSVRIELFVDDPDKLVERALAAGATPAAPVEDHEVPWGTHRQGGFTDPFGHNWSVGDKSPLRRFEG